VPIGIVASLVICTVLYIAVAAVLTGMVPYNQINIETPVSDAFRQAGLPWARGLISLGAMCGITSVLLVMMLSQPRVWLPWPGTAWSRPRSSAPCTRNTRTPWKATILTGVFVAIGAAFLPLRILADLTNIGTLFAFVVVCAAVLIMRRTHPTAERPFRAPLGTFVPVAGIVTCMILMFSLPPENWLRLFVWLAIGLVIYFAYSRHHSVMSRIAAGNADPGGSVELIQELFRRIYNVPELIRMGASSASWWSSSPRPALMVGFFLPGDSLLVTAGLFAAKGDLNIVWLNLAVIGRGHRRRRHRVLDRAPAGKALYNRPNSFFFRKQHLIKTHEFYEKHGGKTIVIARFVPVIRTFAPVVAGAAEMGYRQFAIYNIAGGIGWVASMTLTGYFLGGPSPTSTSTSTSSSRW